MNLDLPPSPVFPCMTPQCEKKRNDVLTGRDLSTNNTAPDRSGTIKQPPRTYECTTTRRLILRNVVKNSSPVAAICKSIQERLMIEFESSLMTAIEFEPRSSKWRICRSPNKEDTAEVWVVLTKQQCSSCTIADDEKYTVQISGESSKLLDIVYCCVRKAVVRLEFPEFPEGLKSKVFRSVYQLNERLNAGTFATVCRGRHRKTGDRVAVKCVLRKDLHIRDDAAIYDEVAILSNLSHPNITSIIDFFEEPDCYYIVMELMSGGDLFDRIGKKKSYSEADARDLVVLMLKAVAICHQNNVAHCDIKPKNLLLASETDDSFIKLADFGFASRVYRPNSLTKQCGTPFFVAPEILARKPYDMSADIWSAGCIVFLLLSGNLPFKGRTQKELFKNIMRGEFEFNPKEWELVSDDAKDFVSKMLVRNPDDRTTARKALLHPWLTVDACRLSKIGLHSTSQRLRTFNAKMKLRSAMIAVDVVSALKKLTVGSVTSFSTSATMSVTTCGSSQPKSSIRTGPSNQVSSPT